MQSGAPYGRFFPTRVGELNYGTQIILVEPIGTRRQDNVTRDRLPRREAAALRRRSRELGLFFDLFNAINSNTAVNIDWRSGAGFEKATTVLGPRIAKFGVKFDW